MAAPLGAEWKNAIKRVVKDIALLKKAGLPILDYDGNPLGEDANLQFLGTVVYGPPGTPYEGGTWRVRFTFNPDYPFTHPSVGFIDKILHPNVDWASGSICLDAIAKEWTPITWLVGIVESLLPALLGSPNPGDPLNPTAARLMHNPKRWDAKVREATREHAFAFAEPVPAAGSKAREATEATEATDAAAGSGAAAVAGETAVASASATSGGGGGSGASAADAMDTSE